MNSLQRGFSFVRANERLVMIMVSTVIVMSGQGVIAPVLPLFAKSFGVGAAAVGLTLSSFALARLLLNVPMGMVADRRGRRLLLVSGPLVGAVGMIGSGFAIGIADLLVWRFIAGAGSAMYMTGAQIYLVDISTVDTRARVVGTNQGALLFGVTIGPAIGGYLAEWFGFRTPFYVVGIAGLAAAAYAFLRLPETRPTEVAASDESPKASRRELLRSRNFFAVSFTTMAVFLTRAGGRMTLMPLLAAAAFGYTSGSLGLVFTVMAVINLIGIAPAAVLADRYGRKWAIVPSGLVMATALALMASADSEAVFLIAAVLLAVATAIVGPAPAAYAADIAPLDARGLAIGMYRSAGDIGFVIGPVLLGALADATTIGWGLVANAAIVASSALFFALQATETVRREVVT